VGSADNLGQPGGHVTPHYLVSPAQATQQWDHLVVGRIGEMRQPSDEVHPCIKAAYLRGAGQAPRHRRRLVDRLPRGGDQVDNQAGPGYQCGTGIDRSGNRMAQRDGQLPQGATIDVAVIPLQIIGRGAQGAGHAGSPARAEVGERRVAVAGAQTSTERSPCRPQKQQVMALSDCVLTFASRGLMT
jgi:hypothetical protein